MATLSDVFDSQRDRAPLDTPTLRYVTTRRRSQRKGTIARSWTFEAARREEAALLSSLFAEAMAHNQGDSRGAAYLRLRLARGAEPMKNDDRPIASLRAVIAAPIATVAAGEPIRVAALLQLASIEAARKQIGEASALFRAT